MTRVTLIGLGEVGTVFAEDLATGGHTDLVAWDIAFADPGSPAARAACCLWPGELEFRSKNQAPGSRPGAAAVAA